MEELFAARKRTIIFGVAILALLLGNIFFASQYFLQAAQITKLQAQIDSVHTNQKAVNFLKLFIEKVLKTDQEVPFEDRLKLENAIRDLQDPVLLAKWEAFTNGTNIDQIQSGVKELLEALVNKIAY